MIAVPWLRDASRPDSASEARSRSPLREARGGDADWLWLWGKNCKRNQTRGELSFSFLNDL